jgi:hypothetical protein
MKIFYNTGRCSIMKNVHRPHKISTGSALGTSILAWEIMFHSRKDSKQSAFLPPDYLSSLHTNFSNELQTVIAPLGRGTNTSPIRSVVECEISLTAVSALFLSSRLQMQTRFLKLISHYELPSSSQVAVRCRLLSHVMWFCELPLCQQRNCIRIDS